MLHEAAAWRKLEGARSVSVSQGVRGVDVYAVNAIVSASAEAVVIGRLYVRSNVMANPLWVRRHTRPRMAPIFISEPRVGRLIA